jgi:hypothetical protein
VVVTSLIHAYNILPYNSILLTRALSSANLTLIFYIPNNLQFVLTALKLRLAEFNRAFNTDIGVVSLFAIMIPKYLKLLTVSIS